MLDGVIICSICGNEEWDHKKWYCSRCHKPVCDLCEQTTFHYYGCSNLDEEVCKKCWKEDPLYCDEDSCDDCYNQSPNLIHI